jgi:hypothetical protein
VWRSLSVLAAALLLVACAARPTALERTPTPEVIVVPTELPNGRVEVALRPRYILEADARVDMTIVAARGTITGPLEARIMASGINEGGAPAEVLVRRLGVTSVTVPAGRRATATVSWDGRDEFGVRVPADAYVLLLEFESSDSGTTRKVRAAATLQMND